MLITPPFFHEPKYTKYATCVPGIVDISSWFRPFSMEIQLWNMTGEVNIEEDEPLFYANFQTDKPIKLKRFTMNEKLYGYSAHCSQAPNWQGKHLPILNRYRVFKNSRMSELILKEIQKECL